MIEVRKIKTKEEYEYASKVAKSDNHVIPNATHILYNKEGDVVGVREKSQSLQAITASLAANPTSFDWLEWNESQMSGRFITTPERSQIPENIKEQLIVELYSK